MRLFNQQKQEYNLYRTVKKVARNMIIRAVDDKFICSLKHPRTIYANVEPITILQHLWNNYGTVEADDLEENEKRMKAPWCPPETIETLFEQLLVGQTYAVDAGGETCADTTIVRWGYENIKNTGLFDSPCEKWREKPRADRTWDAFKKHFTRANNHRLKTTNTGTADYSANAMNHTEVQDMIRGEVHSILSQHSQNDCSTITETQHTPPAANAVTMEAIRKLIQDTMAQNLTCKPTTDTTPRTYTNPHQAIVNGNKVTYCWSHGITRNLDHNSCTCSNKKEGHQEDATYYNRKGGSEDTMRPRRYPKRK